MEGSFFLRGFIIGLSVAAVIGPMSILCMQRTLSKGHLYGMVSGLGVATADAVYGSVAAFGLTVIAGVLVSQLGWLRMIGGLFLVYLGIKTALSKPAERAAAAHANNYGAAYISTFLLTLTNPLTILSFAAIFAGLGVGGEGTGKSYHTAALVVGGVFSGSALWWCLLTSGISLLRQKFTSRWLLWVNRISGAVLTLFGIVVLLGPK
jgi:threonine/homoserine/homoserine lactone efflux protein